VYFLLPLGHWERGFESPSGPGSISVNNIPEPGRGNTLEYNGLLFHARRISYKLLLFLRRLQREENRRDIGNLRPETSVYNMEVIQNLRRADSPGRWRRGFLFKLNGNSCESL
jgi:hypothetical protein